MHNLSQCLPVVRYLRKLRARLVNASYDSYESAQFPNHFKSVAILCALDLSNAYAQY